MKINPWLMPVATFLGGLSVAGLALVPFERLWKQPDPVVVSAPPPQPAPVATAPTPKTAPANPDDELYSRHIEYLRSISKINTDAGNEMIDMGGLDQAKATLDKAVRTAAIATCLDNERQRKVPFYEAKATCNAASS